MPTSPARSTWAPHEIRRVVRVVPSSTCTTIVVTDAGEGYLKAMGNPEGEHVLACEWVGTNLARWFGLRTFDFSLIDVPSHNEVEIPLGEGRLARPGPAFITRADMGTPWGGSKRQLKGLSNPEDISRLVVFDTWTLNCDRFFPPQNRCNRDNVFLSSDTRHGMLLLRAMDHTHCFTCGRELTRRLSHMGVVREESLYGSFPEFRAFLTEQNVRSAVRRLGELTRQEVEQYVQSIPPQWEVRSEAREALGSLIVDRAAFVLVSYAHCTAGKVSHSQRDQT